MSKQLKRILNHVQFFTGGGSKSGDLLPENSRTLMESLRVGISYSGVSILGKQAVALT